MDNRDNAPGGSERQNDTRESPDTPGIQDGPKTRDNEVIIGLPDDVDTPTDAAKQHAPAGSTVLRTNPNTNLALVRLPESADTGASIADIDAQPGVKFAEENPVVSLDGSSPSGADAGTDAVTPNDPNFSSQYAPQQVNAPEAWDTTTGASDVTVAVLDQGVMYDHEDLDAHMDDSVQNHGVDFAGTDTNYQEYPAESTDPYPQQFDAADDWWDSNTEAHGTQVAGIIAGVTDNGTGIAGLSDCSVLSVRVLASDGYGSGYDIADGIAWAADYGADVINLSLGSKGEFSAYDTAINYAEDKGAITIGSAGNNGEELSEYGPGSQCHLAVSAVESGNDGSLASFSNTGDYVDITAPGTSYYNPETTYPCDLDTGNPSTTAYEGFSGTSMSAPVVSGVAALVLSADSSLSVSELTSVLKTSARDVGLTAKEQGAGHVDADAALQEVDAQLGIDVTGDTISPGGSATLSITPSGATQVTVEDLWLDWSDTGTVSWDANPDSVTDNGKTDGTVVFSWNSATSSEFTLTIEPPSRYVGGEYVLTVSATDGNETVETTTSLTIQ